MRTREPADPTETTGVQALSVPAPRSRAEPQATLPGLVLGIALSSCLSQARKGTWALSWVDPEPKCPEELLGTHSGPAGKGLWSRTPARPKPGASLPEGKVPNSVGHSGFSNPSWTLSTEPERRQPFRPPRPCQQPTQCSEPLWAPGASRSWSWPGLWGPPEL